MTATNLKARVAALEVGNRAWTFEQAAEQYARGHAWREMLDEVIAENERREGRPLTEEEREWFDAFAARVAELRAEHEATLPRRPT